LKHDDSWDIMQEGSSGLRCDSSVGLWDEIGKWHVLLLHKHTHLVQLVLLLLANEKIRTL